MRKILFGIVFCVLSFSSQKPRLVGGWEAFERFPAVFLFSEYKDEFTESFCTASKISEKHFVTSAHCVLVRGKSLWLMPSSSQPGQKWFYSFGRNFKYPERVFPLFLKKVHLHPLLESCLKKEKYSPAQCQADGLPTPDVAVVEIESIEGPFLNAPSLPIDFEPVEPGDEIIMLGYGSQYDGDVSPPVLKYGYSKVATHEQLCQALEGISSGEIGEVLDEGFYFGSLGPLLMKGFPNLGSGDSGGPVIKEFPDRIVGLNSSAICSDDSGEDCEVTNNSFFARVDAKGTLPLDSWFKKILGKGLKQPELF